VCITNTAISIRDLGTGPDYGTLLDIAVNTQLQNLTEQEEITNTTVTDNQNITG